MCETNERFFRFRLDNKSAGRQSVASNLMKPDDEVDDADSMAAYGEGDTGKNQTESINKILVDIIVGCQCYFIFQFIIFMLPIFQSFIFFSFSVLIQSNHFEGMNEDGSFIGQYGRKGRNQDSNAQAFATLV